MLGRPRGDPEPIEIVLVRLPASGHAAPRSHRPPPAGAGSIPPAGVLLHRAFDRARHGPPPALGPDRYHLDPWIEREVHRRLPLPFHDAVAALLAVLHGTAGGADGATPRPCPARTRLVVDGGPPPDRTEPADDDRRFRASLVRGRRRATAVELVVTPWSTTTSDLGLALRRRRAQAHPPRRYFDAAHRVMDDLSTRILAAPSGAPPTGRNR